MGKSFISSFWLLPHDASAFGLYLHFQTAPSSPFDGFIILNSPHSSTNHVNFIEQFQTLFDVGIEDSSRKHGATVKHLVDSKKEWTRRTKRRREARKVKADGKYH